MGKIYGHSSFTIAASGAKDSSIGWFCLRKAATMPIQEYPLVDESIPRGPDNPLILKATYPQWNVCVENSALSKRG